MTFKERNQAIDDALNEFKQLHDEYTASKNILTDEQWGIYIKAMDDIAEKYKNTNMETIMQKLNQAFLDDTEMVQQKLKNRGK